MTPPNPHPQNITIPDITAATSRYDAHLPSDLRELDRARFQDLPARVAKRHDEDEVDGAYLTKGEVEELVRWKLAHGTYRPTLLSLVRSNPPQTIQETTSQAFGPFLQALNTSSTSPSTPSASTKSNVKHRKSSSSNNKESSSNALETALFAALTTLTTLKGIGPATASLLLSVCAPESVQFFSDEMFNFFAAGEGGAHVDWNAKIKAYGVKQYREVVWGGYCALKARLGVDDGGVVSAVDLERAVWVWGREARMGTGVGEAQKGEGAGTEAQRGEAKAGKVVDNGSAGKRKVTGEEGEKNARSKRIRRSGK